MGGGAFAAAVPTEVANDVSLHTPRMNPETYVKLRDIYTARLSNYFASGKVAHLKEAPGKTDYGDIDFMIAIDGFNNFPDMALATGASAYIVHGPGKCSLAVKQNCETSDSPPVRYKVKQDMQKVSDFCFADEVFAQIDIEIIDPIMLEWRTWHSSYGDMSAILGHVVRDLGFTLSSSGLWLRMKELDESKDAQYQCIPGAEGKLLLSRAPTTVMQFLGLDAAEYERGFSSMEDLFAWLSACRMLLPKALMQKRNNSRDRQKGRKRGVFTAFFEEWLPANKVAFSIVATPISNELPTHREDVNDALICNESLNPGNNYTDGTTPYLEEARDRYLHESLEYFGLHDMYDEQRAVLMRFTRNNTAIHLLKPIITEQSGRSEKSLGEIIKAMRRWVGFHDGNPIVLNQPQTDKQSQLYQFLDAAGTSFGQPNKVAEFVKQNWEDLRSRERARMKAV